MRKVKTETKSRQPNNCVPAVLYTVLTSKTLQARRAEPRIRRMFTRIDPRMDA